MGEKAYLTFFNQRNVHYGWFEITHEDSQQIML